MEYKERISSITNLTMDAVIDNCRSNISQQYRKRPYSHPELNHGLDLLTSEEGLDCYIVAYGEMHQAKCRAAMQNMPFPPREITHSSLSLEIIDWGCGQGIGTLCLIDFLKDRDLTKWLKKITLIEPSTASLNRAIANVSKATFNSVNIIPINEYLPSISDENEVNIIHFEYNYIFHIFSNILDVTDIDLAKLAKSIAIPGHSHYILCMGPLNGNAFRIDRFCEIFSPTVLFSNISSSKYGSTTDTNYNFTCKTKAFVYEGGSLDFSKYNPNEKAIEPVYNEYSLELQIANNLISKEKAKVYSILRCSLSDNDLIYLDPDINGAIPDFIIVRPNVGVVIISLFEEDLSNCQLENEDDDNKKIIIVDQNSKPRLIDSPLVILDNYQNLIIEGIKEFTEAIIDNYKNLSLVKKVLICTKGTIDQAKQIRLEDKHIAVYGNEFLNDETRLSRILNDIKFYYRNQAFDNVVLNKLLLCLSPKWHSYREGKAVNLTRQQKSLSQSIRGAQRKISGVAGSGKTLVLVTRAVNAQVRTGGKVLLLIFNIALANYIRMRISEVRADFPWDKIDIDTYHRFFRKQANANNLNVNMSSYYDEDFFENVLVTNKYDAIFIDEVQDFHISWLKLLQNSFLKEDGEFVVFGDPKQNIYHNDVGAKGDVNLGIIRGGWSHELDKSMRLVPALANFAMAFQRTFYAKSETINIPDSKATDNRLQFNLMEYCYIEDSLPPYDIYKKVYRLCNDFICANNLSVNDIAIISTQKECIQEIDYLYRQESGKDTMVTFVKKEIEDRIKSDKRKIDRLEKVEKSAFTMVTHSLKLATIHSFKGWDASTVICIIQKGVNNNVDKSHELIYTGITRAKENLFVINIGHRYYDVFFKTNLTNYLC